MAKEKAKPKQRHLKICCPDGIGSNIRLIDEATGDEIAGLCSVEIGKIDGSTGFVPVHLTFEFASMDMPLGFRPKPGPAQKSSKAG